MRTQKVLDDFTRSYIETALWLSTDEQDQPLDERFEIEDIESVVLQNMIDDCAQFQQANADDIGDETERAGHDFWLTRNGHGAGFWDGDWPEPAATRLTLASKVFGEVNLTSQKDYVIEM